MSKDRQVCDVLHVSVEGRCRMHMQYIAPSSVCCVFFVFDFSAQVAFITHQSVTFSLLIYEKEQGRGTP